MPNRMSDKLFSLIWIHSVWHSDVIHNSKKKKEFILKKNQQLTKISKDLSTCSTNLTWFLAFTVVLPDIN